ncbi:Hypothetical protein Bxe_A4391 [Paraburkholderia xenovorans LB400]|uniref:Uncharacterized protein n=1 Tax=Paraburkholderia xenovorans (strain LB400) TaxID=266265 RepID=Q146Y0_PARXL|nr:Hypothetical protein Bxe_A4391 [Paraburkholderia xenovorans LB400]
MTGAGGVDGADEGGVAAAGALPALAALLAPGAADVALSWLAAPAAGFAAGVAEVAGDGADIAAGALVAAAGMAVAWAFNGAANVRLTLPSAHTARSAARPTVRAGRRDRVERNTPIGRRAFTTAPSTAQCAAEAPCRATPARYKR